MFRQPAPTLIRPEFQVPKFLGHPEWPEGLKSFDDLSAYLLTKKYGSTVALGIHWYDVDFYPGCRPSKLASRDEGTADEAPGDQVRTESTSEVGRDEGAGELASDDPAYDISVYDESVYTTDDPRVPYVFMLFGMVCTPLSMTVPKQCQNSHCTFVLKGGDRLPEDLKKAFAHQVRQLARLPVEEASDFPNTSAVPCTGTKGDAIFVHTDHMNLSPALLFKYVDGELERFRTGPGCFPVDVGEWVLIQATLHRRRYSSGARKNEVLKYEVLARHIKVLGTTAALLAARADEAVESGIVHAAQGAAGGEHGVDQRASTNSAPTHGAAILGEGPRSVVANPDVPATGAAENSPDPTTPKKRTRKTHSPPAVLRRSLRKASTAMAKGDAHDGGDDVVEGGSPPKRARRGRKDVI
ncbi:hypothetical protein B0H12DRAFT_1068159 [Mycena haematopus]|nr:hypothetical protein B0H12DRAFT_1068159 [Mycena haematopus]